MDSVSIAFWLDQRFPRMWMPLSLLVPCPERKEWRGDETYLLKFQTNLQEGPACPQCEDLQGAGSGSRPVCQKDLQDPCELKQQPVLG